MTDTTPLHLLRSLIFFLSLFGYFSCNTLHSAVETIGRVPWKHADFKARLQEFSRLYQRRPIERNGGGMNSAHLFYVWFVTQQLRPAHIIESGVWKGQSTWLLEQSALNTPITAIDPVLGRRVYISKQATYTTVDFAKQDWSHIDRKNTLCFFDDHQGAHRVKQCYERGFKHILYDDNYPGPGGNLIEGSLSIKATLAAGGADAEFLRSIMKIYYEFPPIFTPRTVPKQWQVFGRCTPVPLLRKVSHPYHTLYFNESGGYRWLTYIELK